MFFQPELGLSVLDLLARSADSVRWTSSSSAKTRNRKGSLGARSLPLRCLSQFFSGEKNINCLGNEFSVRKSTYLSLMGWPDIYNG